MAYDERLAERVRQTLARHADITEKKMFGGLAFLSRGRMCCGVIGTDLVVRVMAGDHGVQQSGVQDGARARTTLVER